MLFFKTTDQKKVCGIIIVPGPEVTAKKYRYIDNTHRGISTFLAMAKRKFPESTHVNFYSNGIYIDRIYLE